MSSKYIENNKNDILILSNIISIQIIITKKWRLLVKTPKTPKKKI